MDAGRERCEREMNEGKLRVVKGLGVGRLFGECGRLVLCVDLGS